MYDGAFKNNTFTIRVSFECAHMFAIECISV